MDYTLAVSQECCMCSHTPVMFLSQNNDIQRKLTECINYAWGLIRSKQSVIHTLPARLISQLILCAGHNTLKDSDVWEELLRRSIVVSMSATKVFLVSESDCVNVVSGMCAVGLLAPSVLECVVTHMCALQHGKK
eukprot:PhF_6_TR7932/c0_g1_i5/m.11910